VGFFAGDHLDAVGILCGCVTRRSTTRCRPGIGHRLDGWANRDLDVGKVVALAPDLFPLADLLAVSEDAVRDVLRHWGVGKFDAELVLDGKT
jgi:hypothetical protein